MTDKEIKELFDIPHSTLWTWKNGKSGLYKKNIYSFLRSLTKEEALQIISRFRKNKKEEKERKS